MRDIVRDAAIVTMARVYKDSRILTVLDFLADYRLIEDEPDNYVEDILLYVGLVEKVRTEIPAWSDRWSLDDRYETTLQWSE